MFDLVAEPLVLPPPKSNQQLKLSPSESLDRLPLKSTVKPSTTGVDRRAVGAAFLGSGYGVSSGVVVAAT
jgi:hypothetical protein